MSQMEGQPMSRMHAALWIAAVLIAVGAVLVLCPGFRGQMRAAEFQEFHVMETYISGDGSAECRLLSWLPPSQFASYLKEILSKIGEEELMKSYEMDIRKSYAMRGFELENFSGEISGLGENENFTLLFTWRIPHFARWDGESWELDLNWVDERMGAEDHISESDSAWVQMRSLVMAIGFDTASYRIFSAEEMFFPEGAVEIRLPDESYFVDYGGGSYMEGSIAMRSVDGRFSAIENSTTVISTENEMTITVDDLLENYPGYVVRYSGPEPENASFLNSVEWLRLDLKYGRGMREVYPVYSDGWRFLSPAQILRSSAQAILAFSLGSEFLLEEQPDVVWPSQELGDWSTAWRRLPREEYLRLAAAAAASEDIPSWFETSVGRMRPSDVLYTFLRILAEFRRSGELPESILVAPVPRGELVWGSHRLGAENAYYLLSEPYVVVGGERALNVIENLPSNTDSRGMVEEICNWTGSNIAYGLSFRSPTSEEIIEIRRGQCRDFANAYIALARTAGIPSRRVNGWKVSEWNPPAGWEFVVTTTPDGRTVASHAWAESLIPGEGWIPLEPQSKLPMLHVGDLPYEVYRQTVQTWIEVLAGYEVVEGAL